MIKSLCRLWTIYKAKPVILVNVGGSATPKPRVTVSVSSRRGSMSVFSYVADDASCAKATMHSRDLGRILGLKVHDTRPTGRYPLGYR